MKNHDKAIGINRIPGFLILAKDILILNYNNQLAKANCNDQ